MTQSTEENGVIFSGERVRGHSYGEQHQVEDAVMASEIEALPDRKGFVKFASRPAWSFVAFDYFDLDKRADRKSTRLNSSHLRLSRMPSSA